MAKETIKKEIEEVTEEVKVVEVETKPAEPVEPVKAVSAPAKEQAIEVKVLEKRKSEFLDENKRKVTGIQLIVEITVGETKVTRLIQEYI